MPHLLCCVNGVERERRLLLIEKKSLCEKAFEGILHAYSVWSLLDCLMELVRNWMM